MKPKKLDWTQSKAQKKNKDPLQHDSVVYPKYQFRVTTIFICVLNADV